MLAKAAADLDIETSLRHLESLTGQQVHVSGVVEMPEAEGQLQPRQWYVFTDGQQYGPYPEAQLAQWISGGRIDPAALFSCGQEWIDIQAAWVTISRSRPGVQSPGPDQVIIAYASSIAEPGSSTDAPATRDAEDATSAPPDERSATQEPASATAVDTGPYVPPLRDRIVVLGRRASGKTIYLATLYKHLWQSRDGMTMKALAGQVHKELMGVTEMLRQGEWPAATLKTTLARMELEVDYKEQRRILVALDYAGEVFHDAFVNDDAESPQAKALLTHIDRAAAVILLMDPSLAVKGDADAFVDDDFGIVQAIQHIRNGPGGENVPIALVLTKTDQNLRHFKGIEGAREFVTAHYPALMRTLHRCRFFPASAVQTRPNKDGHPRPRPDSVPINIIEPLKYCLAVLDEQKEQERIQAEKIARQQAQREQEEAIERQHRREQTQFIMVVVSAGVIVLCVAIMLILALR